MLSSPGLLMGLGLWLGHLGAGSLNPSLLSDLNPITCPGASLPCFDESIYSILRSVNVAGGMGLEDSLWDLRGIIFPSCDPAYAPLKWNKQYVAGP